jgi:predicted Zn-dependent protease
LSNRLESLAHLLSDNPNDPFLLYAYALELAKSGETEKCLHRLEALTESHPEYHAAHFRLGQMLSEKGNIDRAKHWLTVGIAAANRTGDHKAVREMDELLQSL